MGEVDAAVDHADDDAVTGGASARAASTFIARMSHWHADNGSGPSATPKKAAQSSLAWLAGRGAALTVELGTAAASAPSTASAPNGSFHQWFLPKAGDRAPSTPHGGTP